MATMRVLKSINIAAMAGFSTKPVKYMTPVAKRMTTTLLSGAQIRF